VISRRQNVRARIKKGRGAFLIDSVTDRRILGVDNNCVYPFSFSDIPKSFSYESAARIGHNVSKSQDSHGCHGGLLF
jgi:hypothetical protein